MADKPKTRKESFFSRIVSSLFGSSDPETEKRRQLKAIAKELSKSKFKFYKCSSDEALPGMAKFFYEIYKTVSSAQVLLQNAQASKALQALIIDFCLSEKQRKLSEKFTEESIRERSRTMPPKELSLRVKEELSGFISDFDADRIAKIDTLFSSVMTFAGFVCYDYYFLLKKFDSSLPERSFSSSPHFETIRGEYVADDLKDFIAVAWNIPSIPDWTGTFALLKSYKNVDPVAVSAWNKIVSRLRDLRNSQTLELIIQYSSKDPLYRAVYSPVSQHVAEPYIDKVKTQVELVLKKIEQEKQNSKTDELLNQLFGTTAIVRLKNYSARGSEMFERKMISGYIYQQPLNYMKAFLIDYFKKDIREMADLVLVRGKWTVNTLESQMSNAYHSLLDVSDKITEFDETLAEDSDFGVKLKTLAGRSDRDKEAANILRSQLRDINEKVLLFLKNGSQNFIVFAKILRSLLEDKEKTRSEKMLNWKELDHFAERPIKELGVEIY